MSDHPYAERLEAAIEAGTVTADTARAILNWIDPDGRIEPPTERAAAIARDVLEAAGIEYRPAKAPDPTATPRETQRTDPETEAPDADRGQEGPVSTSSRGSQRPQKRRKGRNRTQPPNQPAAASAAAQAAQATPSKPSRKSATARSRAAAAWAEKHPAQAAAFLRRHVQAVLDLLAADADHVHGDELRELYYHLDQVEAAANFAGRRHQLKEPPSVFLGDFVQDFQNTTTGGEPDDVVSARLRAALGVGERELIALLERLPSTVEVDGEPLSVLAAARETLSPDRRSVAMLPTPPRVRVVDAPEDRDRLPDLLPDPTKAERQLVLPNLNPHPSPRGGPAPWLTVFDSLGGVSMMPGRGAPLDLRLFVEALAWAPPAARRGRMVDVPLTVRELAEALWPHGWQRGRDLPKLRNAMRAINALGFFSTPDARLEWAPVLWRAIPGQGARLDDHALLQVQLPPIAGAGAGARFDRLTARRLGVSSAPEFRAYLGLVHEWDRRLIRGVRPRPGHFLPGYPPAARRLLIFGDDPANRSTLRTRQADADRAFESLADRGVIELDHDPRDPRIFIPERRDLD